MMLITTDQNAGFSGKINAINIYSFLSSSIFGGMAQISQNFAVFFGNYALHLSYPSVYPC
jgi:hypothetical protein